MKNLQKKLKNLTKKKLTLKDVQPRNLDLVGTFDRARTFSNKKRLAKQDAANRKKKHKGQSDE